MYRNEFTDRIIFMLMYNEINWKDKKTNDVCIKNTEAVSEYARKS